MALDTIVERKRLDVAERQNCRSHEEIAQGLSPSDRSLADAVAARRTGFIFECKRASPSRGLLRADYDAAELARGYQAIADAVSVLADEPYFLGSLEHVGSVRRAIDKPVLCKDFVLGPYQVAEARAHGADAVLLMLSVLDDETAAACMEEAERFAVDCLVEVHDEEELERGLALGARIIGINNRDLRTLEVDLDRFRRLAPRVPGDRLVVCESGIRDHADVRGLRNLADAFLVGTSMTSSEDPALACRSLAHGRVKVCGLTRADDVRAAWRAGATYGGLIFAEGSPRRIGVERAESLRQVAPLAWVGVFVNSPVARVAALASRLRLRAVQLHGDETPAQIAALRAELPPGCEIWKALGVGPDREIRRRAETGADRLVLDTRVPGHRGGTGKTFDWSLLRSYPERAEVMVAGGLTAENAAEAAALEPWALDVSSGVEEEPGIKSEALLEAFFGQLRGHGRTRGLSGEQP